MFVGGKNNGTGVQIETLVGYFFLLKTQPAATGFVQIVMRESQCQGMNINNYSTHIHANALTPE